MLKYKSIIVAYYSTIKDLKSLFGFVIALLFSVLPMYTKYKYRCEECKNKFN